MARKSYQPKKPTYKNTIDLSLQRFKNMGDLNKHREIVEEQRRHAEAQAQADQSE